MPRRKPTSNVGAAMTRFNAVEHGLTAQAPVIPGVESLEEWEAHRAAMFADRQPQGHLESQLVERIATLTWRLQRVAHYECESIAVSRERVEFDLAEKRKRSDEPKSLAEADARIDDAKRCLQILEHLHKTPPESPLPATDVSTILDELADRAERDADEFYDGIDLPPDGVRTAGELVAIFEALSERDSEAITETLAQTISAARTIASGREHDRVSIAEELDRMLRERLLPDGPTLDRITRYETALNRMLHQAISQLEAAQSRRAGAPIPLARVQVYGVAG